MIDPISIGIWLLAGAAVGAAVVIFWKDIREFFIKSWNALPQDVRHDLHGVVAFAQKIDAKMMSMLNYYSYNVGTNEWSETIVTKTITANDIPEHIRNRMQTGQKVNITDDLQKELKLTL